MKVTITTPPDFLLQQAALSDLFFNHDCWRYDMQRYQDYQYAQGGEVDDGKNARHRAALMADAVEFAETLRNATGICVEASDLVEDYLARE